ncbi:TonB-dependent receptor [Maricurvus nonylphenolicus]
MAGMQVSAEEINSLALEEIVVTAQKRAQTLQDVPISVNTVGGEKLNEAGIENLEDLANYVPNFTKFESGVGPIMKIRGIGSGANPGIERSVVLYMDDLSYSRATLANAPLLDLERVEVLRGPQNVLFGKNSVAGALSLTSAKPTDEFEASVSGSYDGRYDDKELTGIVSGPLSDTVRARLVLRGLESSGYYDNKFTGNDEQRRNSHTGRLTLAWDVSDKTEVIFKAEKTRVDNRGEARELALGYLNNGSNPDAVAFTGLNYAQAAAAISGAAGYDIGSDSIGTNRTRRSNIDESQDIEVDNYQITLNTSFEHFDLTSVTGFVGYEDKRIGDTDGNGVALFYNDSEEEYSQFSQEIRLTSNGSSSFDWIAGIYLQTSDLDSLDKVVTPQNNIVSAVYDAGLFGLGTPFNERAFVTDFSTKSDMAAIFAQGTWELQDDLRLTLGGRYTYEKKEGERRADTINALTGGVNDDLTDFLTAAGAVPGAGLSNDIIANIAYSLFAGVDLDSLGQFVEDNAANPVAIGTFDAIANALSGIYGDGSVVSSADFVRHNIDPDRTETAFTPSVIVEYDLNEDHMMYFSASKGFKAGGFDAEASRASSEEFEDENVNAYEIGMKSVWMDGSAETNLAVFYTEYSDLQSSSFNGRNFVVTNVGEAVTQGIELDGRWRIAEPLTLTGALAFTDFEATEFPGASCSASEKLAGVDTSEGCDRSGDRDRSLSGTLSLEYLQEFTPGVDFRATLDLNYQDQYLADTATRDKLTEQDAYTLYNLRLGLEGDRWSLALLGKNLTDEEVIGFASEVPFSYALTGAPAYSTYLAPPRTVALQFAYSL